MEKFPYHSSGIYNNIKHFPLYENMKKICIIGIRATGKSILARLLSRKLHLPVCYTDSLWWKPNWQVAEEQFVENEVRKVLNTESWIIEGYIEPLGKEKIEAADLVVYLDHSPLAVVINGLKRYLMHRKKPRAELPEGCLEKMTWEDFFVLLLRKEKAEIEAVIKTSTPKRIVRIQSRKALEKWLTKL